MKTEDILKRARTTLLLDHPFWGNLAMRLVLEEDETVDTCVTDGEKLWYNPEFIDSLSKEEIHGAIAHECFHIANGHTWRMGNRDEELWNTACDHVINLSLKEAGFTLPNDVFCDASYREKKRRRSLPNYLQKRGRRRWRRG